MVVPLKMDFNKTEAHGLLLGLFPGNDCRVIVYGIESLVTGDNKPKGHTLDINFLDIYIYSPKTHIFQYNP